MRVCHHSLVFSNGPYKQFSVYSKTNRRQKSLKLPKSVLIIKDYIYIKYI